MSNPFKLSRSSLLQSFFFFFLTILIVQSLDNFQNIDRSDQSNFESLSTHPFNHIQAPSPRDESDSAALLLPSDYRAKGEWR